MDVQGFGEICWLHFTAEGCRQRQQVLPKRCLYTKLRGLTSHKTRHIFVSVIRLPCLIPPPKYQYCILLKRHQLHSYLSIYDLWYIIVLFFKLYAGSN